MFRRCLVSHIPGKKKVAQLLFIISIRDANIIGKFNRESMPPIRC